MEIKLKSGGKALKVNNVTLDMRDELLDAVKYTYNNKNVVTGVEMMHSTITKWIRMCIDGSDDKFIMKLSVEDRTEIFTQLQDLLLMGEGKASK